MIRDYAMLQAMQLRVSWEEKDVDGIARQLANVESVEEARDIMIALTIMGNTPVNAMRNMLSEGF